MLCLTVLQGGHNGIIMDNNSILSYVCIIRKETDEWKELAIDVQQKLHKEIAYMNTERDNINTEKDNV